MPRWSSFDGAADRTLVQGINSGDGTSLAALYDAYSERLYDYCVSMTGEYKTAVDIVHDTFIDAWRRAPRMRDHTRLRAWLYGAARRRCLQRGRTRNLHWEQDADFADLLRGGGASRDADPRADGTAAADAAAPPDEAAPDAAELSELLERSLARLDPYDQEMLLLSVRHGLDSAEIGAAMGLSARRAAARTARAHARLRTAYEDEQAMLARRCPAAHHQSDAAEDTGPPHRARAAATERRSGRSRRPAGVLTARRPHRAADAAASGVSVTPAPDAPPGDRNLSGDDERQHDDCPRCRSRRRVKAAALLVHAPSPVLPAALRHRIMHTATDPELAGYRTDIAARGGPLTPDGMPNQPDVPSPYTRRWLFSGGGMAGALVAALVAALLIGPGLPPSTISWPPFRTHPQPAVTPDRPTHRPDGNGGTDARPPLAQAPGGPGVPPGVSPRPGGDRPTPSPSSPVSPSPSPPTTPPVPPSRPGVPTVVPAKVELYGTKTAQVRLTAENGPMVWSSSASTDKITVSPANGTLQDGDSVDVTITLHTSFLNPPGEGSVVFSADKGTSSQLSVVWGFYFI